MTKGKTQSGEAAPEASRKSLAKKGKASPAVEAAIANRLRAYYAGVAQEPVPERFLELLKQLDIKDSGR